VRTCDPVRRHRQIDYGPPKSELSQPRTLATFLESLVAWIAVVSGNSSPRLMRPRGSNNSACRRGVSDEKSCQRRRCHSSDQPASG